jgi:predicted nucleic acid-binding protein
MRRVLIGTGAIYAFVTRTDRHHQEARSFVREWLSQGGTFVLPDLIFAETMALLKARLGAKVAVRVGQELRQNPACLWVALGPDGERDTWATFQQHHDEGWSYADCALLVLARQLKIVEVFAFDEHFAQMPGLIRVPAL